MTPHRGAARPTLTLTSPLLIAALLIAALLGPTAARGDTAQVTVVSPGGAQQTLSLEALAGGEDVASRTYALRSDGGESTATLSGFSLAAIVEAAGADPFSFSYLEVQRPGGGSVLLSRHQALDPGAFPEGPPVIYATAAGTGFLRPSGGPGDLNAADSFESPQGISIVLSKRLPLRVRAQASPVRTRPGRPVEFRATVEGGGAGEQLIYSWYFDDGKSATGEGVHHAFAERGSYDVVVGVTTPGDSTGSSAVVRVQVGAPIGGPDREGGGRNHDADAPDHGAAGSSGSSGGGGESSSASTGAASATQDTSSAPPPSTRPIPPPPVTQAPRHAHRAPAGQAVSGILVNGAERQPRPAPEARAPAARSGRPGGEGTGSGLGVPGAALGLLTTAGLLGLGALAEARGSLFSSFLAKGPRGALP